MNKKYLMNGFAALALIASVSSCTKDVTAMSQADQEAAAKENAELQLGLNIPDGQTWDMSTQVTAVVDVNLNPSETYTVGICDKNPLNFDDAKFYVLKNADGGRISATFTAPIAKKDYYVIAYNSKYQAIVNQVEATNGAINANVTRTSGAKGELRSAHRAIACSFPFPKDADKSKFLAAVPAGVAKITQNASSVNGYIDETWQGDLNIWGAYDGSKTSGGTIYLKGNLDFSERKFYIAPNTEVYLLEGTTLTLRAEDCGNLQSGCNYYMAANTKIVAQGELKLNNGLHIYNHGTIEAPKLSTNSNSLLYNVGTVTVKNKISVENDLSVIVNDGTITAADLNTAGSGKFQNNNKVVVSGTTFVNSNNNAWVNNGTYQTGNFIYNAASDDVINNCKMIVDEDFNMNLGDNPGNGNFKMDANSSVKTKYFNGGGNWNKTYSIGDSKGEGGPFYIYMGAASMFEVTETATMNATKADYGIYGPEEGAYAVFKAKKIVAGKDNQGYEITYGNNLAVVCESHFAQGYSGSYPYIDYKGNATLYEGSSAAPDMEAIKASLCSGEFNPGSGTGKFLNEPEVYTFAFEDQISNGDYDMNDVVLKISYHAVRDEEGRITEIKQNKLDVKMVAAGATFNLEAYVGDHKLFNNEVHAAFGVNEGVMVNTGRNTSTVIPEDLGVQAPENWDGDFKNLDVKIHVLISKPYWIEYLTDKEKVSPYAIMIPNDWRWPTERTCVTEAYPGKNTANAGEPVVFDDEYSFRKWAETPNADRTDAMKSWFNYYLKGKTMTNASATAE